MPKYFFCRFKETVFSDFMSCINYETPFPQEYILQFVNMLNGKWFKKLAN